MNIKASGCSALILTAGFLVLLASPTKAATEDSVADSKSDRATTASVHRNVRHTWHQRRSYAHRRLRAIAVQEDANDKKAAATEAPADNGQALPEIPPSIANANAQMLLAGVQFPAVAAIPAGSDVAAAASENPPGTSADSQIVVAAADQLNDVDRALQENSSQATASASPQPASATTMTSENSVWDQTSLIGKVFIGFGALLTMASAARMFIT
jgi:hypothetical protein